MQLNPIALAIPVFFALIGVELWASRRRRLSTYRFADALADLGCGIGNQVMALAFGGLQLAAYVYAYEHWSLIRFGPGSPWPWVLAFVGVDFTYYWWHRFSHEVNFMWAAHVVHHQSEDYNLAVALRQAWFTSFTILPFYGLLAFVGVPPLAYGLSAAASLLYQFWIHTELISKLPRPFEYVFNTPSHHRVHHAINREYLDRNYGGILIVWDRMFGTFEPERAPCVYGVTKPLRSFNPVWANFEYWAHLWKQAKQAPGLLSAARVFVARPGWNPVTRAIDVPPQVAREQFVKFDVPEPSRRTRRWILAQFAATALGLTALLLFAQALPRPLVLAAGALVVAATAAWAGIVEGKRWAWALEWTRLVGSAAVVGWAFVAIAAAG